MSDVRADVWLRCRGECEVRAEGCTRRADGLHHRFKPGRIDTRANLVAVCDACHTQSPAAIHRNVAASVNSGLLRRSWDGLPELEWVRDGGTTVPYSQP